MAYSKQYRKTKKEYKRRIEQAVKEHTKYGRHVFLVTSHMGKDGKPYQAIRFIFSKGISSKKLNSTINELSHACVQWDKLYQIGLFHSDEIPFGDNFVSAFTPYNVLKVLRMPHNGQEVGKPLQTIVEQYGIQFSNKEGMSKVRPVLDMVKSALDRLIEMDVVVLSVMNTYWHKETFRKTMKSYGISFMPTRRNR